MVHWGRMKDLNRWPLELSERFDPIEVSRFPSGGSQHRVLDRRDPNRATYALVLTFPKDQVDPADWEKLKSWTWLLEDPSERVLFPRELGTTETAFYAVIPDVPRRSMAEEIGEGEPLPPRQAQLLAEDLLEALAVYHHHSQPHSGLDLDAIYRRGDRFVLLDFTPARVLTKNRYRHLPRAIPQALDQPPSFAEDLFSLGQILVRATFARRAFVRCAWARPFEDRPEDPKTWVEDPIPLPRAPGGLGLLLPRLLDCELSQLPDTDEALRLLASTPSQELRILEVSGEEDASSLEPEPKVSGGPAPAPAEIPGDPPPDSDPFFAPPDLGESEPEPKPNPGGFRFRSLDLDPPAEAAPVVEVEEEPPAEVTESASFRFSDRLPPEPPPLASGVSEDLPPPPVSTVLEALPPRLFDASSRKLSWWQITLALLFFQGLVFGGAFWVKTSFSRAMAKAVRRKRGRKAKAKRPVPPVPPTSALPNFEEGSSQVRAALPDPASKDEPKQVPSPRPSSATSAPGSLRSPGTPAQPPETSSALPKAPEDSTWRNRLAGVDPENPPELESFFETSAYLREHLEEACLGTSSQLRRRLARESIDSQFLEKGLPAPFAPCSRLGPLVAKVRVQALLSELDMDTPADLDTKAWVGGWWGTSLREAQALDQLLSDVGELPTEDEQTELEDAFWGLSQSLGRALEEGPTPGEEGLTSGLIRLLEESRDLLANDLDRSHRARFLPQGERPLTAFLRTSLEELFPGILPPLELGDLERATIRESLSEAGLDRERLAILRWLSNQPFRGIEEAAKLRLATQVSAFEAPAQAQVWIQVLKTSCEGGGFELPDKKFLRERLGYLLPALDPFQREDARELLEACLEEP